MPLSQNPIVEWPTECRHLLAGLQITTDPNGTRYGHLDLDVDAETLFMLNDFEARVRHRHVRLRLADDAACLLGEMNVLVGLGTAVDATQHIGRIRISFHNIQDDSCVDPVSQA